MKRSRLFVAGVAASATLAAAYGAVAFLPSLAQAAGEAATSSAPRADNFRLADQNFDSYELYRLADAKAIVLVTQANGDAAVRNGAGTLKALKAAYAGKGVEMLMLNSTLGVSRDQIRAEAQQAGFELPILLDANQLVGEQLGVTRSGEVIVIEPKTWRIVYRGALDSAVGPNAIDALIAGKPVKAAAKQAAGSPIAFPARDKAQIAKISYSKDVAPIVAEKCAACHQAGGIGPMQLTSYANVKGFAPMIRETIRTQRMPPFHADPQVGKWHDDKSLSPQQIKTLVHWIEAGAPRGDGPDVLASAKLPNADWPLGKPDLILDIPAYKIPATGVVDYQRPWVNNPLTEGRWIKASTIKVGARQGVHHILTGYMKDAPAAGQQANESRWGASVGGYAVGAESQLWPTNVGTYLPPGGAIGFQNHYTPYGKEAEDKSQIGLYFYPKGETPEMVMRNSVVADQSITIPAGEERHQEVAYLIFPKDALLYSAFPHAHYRGNASKVELLTPDGQRKLLLVLPKYDFNWQREYTFEQPVRVPAGSKLVATYTYDNSTRNPANPDPKKVIVWGDQSFEEMFYTAIRYRWIDETSSKLTNYDDLMNQTRLLGMLDDNINGKIEMAELKGAAGNQLKGAFAMIDGNKDGALDVQELAAANMAMRRRSASN